MATIINSSTNPQGLIQSSDGTAVLKIQTDDLDALTIDASQNLTVNNDLTVAGDAAISGNANVSANAVVCFHGPVSEDDPEFQLIALSWVIVAQIRSTFKLVYFILIL